MLGTQQKKGHPRVAFSINHLEFLTYRNSTTVHLFVKVCRCFVNLQHCRWMGNLRKLALPDKALSLLRSP